MVNELAQKLQYVAQRLSQVMKSNGVQQSVLQAFNNAMNQYVQYANQGASNAPDPNTGFKQLDVLILIIINSLSNENWSQANNSMKRAGKWRYNYWYYPWWWNYWYYYWYPYYWWFNPYPPVY